MDWRKIDLEELVNRLTIYAVGRLDRADFSGRRQGAIPGGAEACDLANDALVRTISNVNPWPVNEISLFEHLKDIIDTQIEEMILSEENLESEALTRRVVQLHEFRFTPEEEAARAQLEQNFLEYLESKRPALRHLAEIILKSPSKSRSADLAVTMNISINDVETLKRALRRATKQFKSLNDAFEIPKLKRDA
jgi:hypothetical protein